MPRWFRFYYPSNWPEELELCDKTLDASLEGRRRALIAGDARHRADLALITEAFALLSSFRLPPELIVAILDMAVAFP